MFMRGFTLIEVLVVTVIVAILAALALPSYSDYLVRGKLTEATSGLADWRVRMEQYYQDNRSYGATAASCPASVPIPASRYFSFTCSGDSQSFTLTATNQANQGLGTAGDFVFTVNHGNTRKTTKFYAETKDVSCWLTKKGDSC